MFVALIAERTQSFGKRPAELLTIPVLPRERLLARRRLRLPLVDFRRHVDARTTFELRAWSIREDRFHPLRLHPPPAPQPVGGQTSLQRRRCDPVLVHVVASCNCTEFLDIQIRVLDLQRIKRPLHQSKTSSYRIFPLRELHPPP